MNSRLLGALLGLAMIAGCSSSSEDAGESGPRVEQLFAGGLIYDGSAKEKSYLSVTQRALVSSPMRLSMSRGTG